MHLYTKLWFVLLFVYQTQAQRLYRFNDHGKTATKKIDLIHTKLNLNFDFSDQTVNGEAWITLSPHFKSIDKLQLDAKQMDVYEVKNGNQSLKFYNSKTHLNIDFPKVYTQNDTLTLYVKYRGNPNNVKNDEGVAITDNKGLYFINPNGKDVSKPTQIWSQGEPEQNSCWFPTIDKPNQKMTQEMILTVHSKYKTLSNGKLISQKNNADNTRTDYWKQALPHAPYLFFVGVGNFEIIKQTWKGKEVSFYVEPSYKDTAEELFKNTTKMLSFFSDLTGIEYPWDKYSQMIVRDYVSGAMENTGAVIHAEQAMLTKGELSERNTWESVIAHEMFHHWFGDLVTTESWANITVNESFANYSEYLWLAHEYGKDRAEEHMLKTRNQYLSKKMLQKNYEKHLVRYNYDKKDDVFDVISYNKGGMILHMLKNYLGEDVFFKGLQYYLKQYQFKPAEAEQLRLALEQVSGEDLKWFFSQWYFSNGHPRLKVTYQNNLITNTVTVKVTQSGKEFDFPLHIEVYEKDIKHAYNVFVDRKEKTFEFPFKDEPILIKTNADHVLLAEIEEPDLTTEQLIYQYKNVSHFVDRMKALELLKDKQESKSVFKLYVQAIDDPYETIQAYALENINLSGSFAKKKVIKKIANYGVHKNPIVAAAAISVLGKLADETYLPIFKQGLENISPKVKGNSLLAMYYVNKDMAMQYASNLTDDVKDYIYVPLLKMYLKERKPEHVTFVAKYLLTGLYFIQNEKLKNDFEKAFDWVASTDNKKAIQTMVDDFVKKGLRYKKYNFNYVCIEKLRSVMAMQLEKKHPNKDVLLSIISQGIEKLALE